MFFRNSRGHVAFGSSAQLLHPALAATALGALLVAASTGSALSHGCMPNHARPLVILKDMGPCNFDPQTMSFAGERPSPTFCFAEEKMKPGILASTYSSIEPACCLTMMSCVMDSPRPVPSPAGFVVKKGLTPEPRSGRQTTTPVVASSTTVGGQRETPHNQTLLLQIPRLEIDG